MITVPGKLVAAGAVTLALIVLGGCGSSSKPSETNTSTQPATTTAPSAPDKAADLQVARNAQLRLTDFPAGWEESDKASETTQSPCQTVNSAKAATDARDTSHTFSKNNTQVDSSVYVYADAATAGRWFSEVSSSATRACFGDAVGKGIAKNAKGQGAKVGEVKTGSLSIEPVGDERRAGRITIPISAGSTTVDAYMDLIFVRADRGIAILLLVDTATPFDQTLGAKLTKAVVDRLTTGLKQRS